MIPQNTLLLMEYFLNYSFQLKLETKYEYLLLSFLSNIEMGLCNKHLGLKTIKEQKIW